jgi:hypothetical protein
MGLKKCDFSRLLEGSNESYYWLGFLMADGHFSKRFRLQVNLSAKDKSHIVLLQQFLHIQYLKLETKKGKEYCDIRGMDTKVMRTIMEKYNIRNDKTKNPCDLSTLTEEQLFCLSIGFIDGDGRIAKVYKRVHPFLAVKCHINWYDNLKLMFPIAKANVTATGYACIKITEAEVLKRMKIRALNLNLPIMTRKWDNIDLNFTSIQQRTKDNIPKITQMLLDGKKQVDICKELGYSGSALSGVLKRNGLR